MGNYRCTARRFESCHSNHYFFKKVMKISLTTKQKQVADEFIITGNQTESYLKFYKNVKNRETARAAASRLFATPDMKEYIDKRMAELDEELIADQREVLRYLTSVLRGEQTEQILRSSGDFRQVIDDIEVSAKDRIKAAELLGKRYGLWTDKIELDADTSVVIIDDI